MVTTGQIVKSFLATFSQEPFSAREMFEHQRTLRFTRLQFPAPCKGRPTPDAAGAPAAENAAAPAPAVPSSPPSRRTDWRRQQQQQRQQHPRISVFRLYHFGQSWSAISPSSPDPEKRWSLDFNSLWIPRTTEPPSRLSDALSGSTCFTGTVERTAGVASGPDSLNHCC